MRASVRKLIAEAYDALNAGRIHTENAAKTRDKQAKATLLKHVRDVIIPSLTASVTHALEQLEPPV